MKMFNTALVKYGIEEEESDYRAHVSAVTKTVFVFETQRAVEYIKTSASCLRQREAWTGDIKTAQGYIISPNEITSMLEFEIPDDLIPPMGLIRRWSTSDKGVWAVNVVKNMFLMGLIRLPLIAMDVTDADLQIRGTDLIISPRFKIQVKCDLKAGKTELGGTGNLYIQTHECNPYRMR